MSLEATINEDIKTAMKAGDKLKLEALRAVKAAIIIAKTEPGASKELNEEQEIKILQKLVKSRKDSLEIFEKQNREDLAEKERVEITVIEKYLPIQMSAGELKEVELTAPTEKVEIKQAHLLSFDETADAEKMLIRKSWLTAN